MRIVGINTCDNGSTGKIVRDIFEALPSDYAKLMLVGNKTTDLPYIVKTHSKLQMRIHEIFSRIFDRDDLGSFFSTKKLIKRVKAFEPSVIFLNNLHGYYINYKKLFDYLKNADVKVVWTLHDCWAFTGHCPYFDRINCEKWKEGCGHCPALKRYPPSYIFDNSKGLFKIKKAAFNGVKDMTIVTPSEWLNTLTKQSFLGEYPVITINNGINMDNFHHVDNGAFDNIVNRSKKILLGVAPGFEERKGFGDFIRLADIISDDYQIVLVGVTDEQKSVMPSTMVGISRTENQKALAELYSIADVFLNLTYEDNFPTTNIEALCCGTPVITYRTGGSVECINEVNGMVADQGDIEEVYECVKTIDGKNLDREKIAESARQAYSSAAMAEKYIKLFNN